jgi:hypothetical protein
VRIEAVHSKLQVLPGLLHQEESINYTVIGMTAITSASPTASPRWGTTSSRDGPPPIWYEGIVTPSTMVTMLTTMIKPWSSSGLRTPR